MKTNSKFRPTYVPQRAWASSLVLAILAFSVCRGSCQLRTLHPDQIVGGRTQAEWSAAWWQWILAQPKSSNPNLDPDGSRAHSRQPGGDVFFLGWAYDGQTTRQFKVPEGKYLFFPVATHLADNVNRPVALNEEMLRTEASAVSLYGYLGVVLDGQAFYNFETYRQISPVFDYRLPTSDPLNGPIASGVNTHGQVFGAVSDGYWVMLPPLSLGSHQMGISYTLRTAPFTLDTTTIANWITVVPEPGTVALWGVGTIILLAMGNRKRC